MYRWEGVVDHSHTTQRMEIHKNVATTASTAANHQIIKLRLCHTYMTENVFALGFVCSDNMGVDVKTRQTSALKYWSSGKEDIYL